MLLEDAARNTKKNTSRMQERFLEDEVESIPSCSLWLSVSRLSGAWPIGE